MAQAPHYRTVDRHHCGRVAVFATTDRFLAVGNLNNLALQVTIVALAAIGSTVVIIVGGIDLSPGSMIALLTMLLASMLKFWGVEFWLAIVLTLAAGAVLGSVNGFVTAYLRIPSFVATLLPLAPIAALHSCSTRDRLSSMLRTGGASVLRTCVRQFFYIVVFFAAAHWLMRYMRLGRCIYAVGGNASAARLSGINVRRTQFLALVIAGASWPRSARC